MKSQSQLLEDGAVIYYVGNDIMLQVFALFYYVITLVHSPRKGSVWMRAGESRFSLFRSHSITVATNLFLVRAHTARPKFKYLKTVRNGRPKPSVLDLNTCSVCWLFRYIFKLLMV